MADRSDKTTKIKPIGPIYSDFMSNFNAHPNTGKLITKTDVEAVRRSLRNLILTNNGERFYRPNLGSGIRNLLFEPATEMVRDKLHTTITETIEKYEKRIVLRNIDVSVIDSGMAYNIDIYFSVISSSDLFNVNIKLDRVR